MNPEPVPPRPESPRAAARGSGMCRVVLVKPHFAGNLGSVARVMRNFGLSDLVLVAPYTFPTNPEARRLATHG